MPYVADYRTNAHAEELLTKEYVQYLRWENQYLRDLYVDQDWTDRLLTKRAPNTRAMRARRTFELGSMNDGQLACINHIQEANIANPTLLVLPRGSYVSRVRKRAKNAIQSIFI